jgi:acyl-CoA synthetase (AMP-forming)/AMP-acid ligase II
MTHTNIGNKAMQADTTRVESFDLNLATRNTLGDALHRVRSIFPERVAVIDGERSFTYEQLDGTAESLAQGFLELGLERGTPVAMLMSNCYEVFTTYFGTVKAGLVVLPINIGLAPEDVGWILQDSETSTVVVDENLLPLLHAAMKVEGVKVENVILRQTAMPAKPKSTPLDSVVQVHDLAELSATPVTSADGRVKVHIEDHDIAQCLYTSGTTSRPKGSLGRHSSVVTTAFSNALMIGHQWGEDPGSMVSVLPLFHVTALNTLCFPLLFTGGTIVLVTPFDPRAVLDATEKYQIKLLMGLPMMWAALVEEQERQPRDLSSVHTAIYAMAQMSETLLNKVSTMMPNARVILGSGQTEVLPATVIQWAEHEHTKPGSWGLPSPTVEVSIMTPEGTIAPRGEPGEIVYRGPHVTSGYWNRPDANEEAFAHGWFHSGDIGWMDDEGVVWFVDRLKDIIKSGGENVSSVKVERVVSGAPGVVECSVIGTYHERWGEAVTAVVTTDQLPSADDPDRDAAAEKLAEDIIAYARERLSGFETPKRVEFIEEFPKTTTGKIRKLELREYF